MVDTILNIIYLQKKFQFLFVLRSLSMCQACVFLYLKMGLCSPLETEIADKLYKVLHLFIFGWMLSD